MESGDAIDQTALHRGTIQNPPIDRQAPPATAGADSPEAASSASTAFAEQLPIAIAVLDLEMHTVSVSPEFAFVVGRDHSEFRGSKYTELLPHFPENIHAVFATVSRTGTALKGDEEHLFAHRDKPDRILWELHPWRSADGTVVGGILVLDVVTRRAQFEESARRGIKNEAVATLCQSFGTELRNLVTLLDGYAQRLAPPRDGEASTGASKAEAFRGLELGLDYARRMADDLGTLGRCTTLQPQPTDLSELLAEVVDEIREQAPAGVRVRYVPREGNWHCLIDPVGLKRSIVAIAENSFEAMPKGGDLTVFLRNSDRHQLTFCVADSGTGMPEGVLRQAAEPFFTTKQGGCFRGLGLSVAYGFVAHSKGDLHIVSAPGKGTQIDISLPFHDWSWEG